LQNGAAMMLGRLVEAGAADRGWAVEELERATVAVWGSVNTDDVLHIENGLRDGPAKERWRWREDQAVAASSDGPQIGAEQRRPLRLPILPESFWDALPVLGHVRRTAHARLVSADLVLHVVLAKLAARSSHELWFDTGRGQSSLNYFAALVAPSGIGKTAGVSAVDHDLLAVPQ
jgi:hypothetical protein